MPRRKRLLSYSKKHLYMKILYISRIPVYRDFIIQKFSKILIPIERIVSECITSLDVTKTRI